MLVVRSVLRNFATRNVAALARPYHAGGHHKEATMNDLPVPEGDFFERHSKRQSRYNKVLIAGILIFVGTLTVTKQSGLIHLNLTPPKSID